MSVVDEPEKGEFRYTDCLEWSDDDITKPQVLLVTFNISRYGNYTHTISFDEPVHKKMAIKRVEEYLSEPLTELYYEEIKDDLFHAAPWDKAKEWFKCRGDCLTDSKFLEIADIDKDGKMTLWCGS